MIRFIKNTAAFTLVFLGLNLLAYHFIAEPLLYKGYFNSENEMVSYRSFMVGDSHAKAIRQNDLDTLKIFNLAYDTDSYFDSALKLKYLIRNKLADTVYVCVDNHTLSHYREWWTNKSRSLYYAEYEDYNNYYKTRRYDFWLAKNMYIYLPLTKTENSKLFKKYLSNEIQGKRARNYDNYDASSSPRENLIKSSINRVGTQFPDEKQSKRLVQTLEEMLKLCNENNIAVMGIKFPLSREYINAMGRKSFKADSLFITKGYKVFDFTNAFPDSTHFFRDQDHVNYSGSKALVKHLLHSNNFH